jgi:hypothetical protein
MKKPETKLKEKVKKDLKTLEGVWSVKTQQVSLRGTPDLLLCVRGFFFAIELKKDAKVKVDPLQSHKLKQIIACGGAAAVVTPTNWPEVFEAIKKMCGQVSMEEIENNRRKYHDSSQN